MNTLKSPGIALQESELVPWEHDTVHDDVIKWKHFPRYWPFVRGIHRSPVNSPHKGQWREALMFSLICVWINGWVNFGMAGVWDAIVPIMTSLQCHIKGSTLWCWCQSALRQLVAWCTLVPNILAWRTHTSSENAIMVKDTVDPSSNCRFTT